MPQPLNIHSFPQQIEGNVLDTGAELVRSVEFVVERLEEDRSTSSGAVVRESGWKLCEVSV